MAKQKNKVCSLSLNIFFIVFRINFKKNLEKKYGYAGIVMAVFGLSTSIAAGLLTGSIWDCPGNNQIITNSSYILYSSNSSSDEFRCIHDFPDTISALNANFMTAHGRVWSYSFLYYFIYFIFIFICLFFICFL